MSRRLQQPLPPRVVALQRQAADPNGSVWLGANAGSGKTHVLADRVVRLLLTGVRPEAILCLTYTKAAAAEMRARVGKKLAGWAVADPAALHKELEQLEGQKPDPARLRRAKTLFAHALETPGGLKIVTIHAFCEAILHRFPLEAGVPFDFAVVDEVEAQRMVLEARESVLARGIRGEALAGPVETLFGHLSDYVISDAIDAALGEARRLRPVLSDVDGAKARLRGKVGHDGRGSAAIREAMTAERLIGPDHVTAILAAGPGVAFEKKLLRVDRHDPAAEDWLATFLTEKLTVPANFPTKAFRSADPALADLALEEAERLQHLAADLSRASLVERSESLLEIVAAITERYIGAKRARSLLDFDDLIERAGALFADIGAGPWVQYKLDAGIAHVLVDESQDTNPEQWEAVKAIAAEFFVGDGAVERPRTVFAVGDPKQSIFSFQGAEPKLFLDTGTEFGRRAREAGQPFDKLRMDTSFRTLPGILDGIDKVFARADIRAGVLSADEPISHFTARKEQGGSITIWPLEREEAAATDTANWPVDATDAGRSAPRRVGDRIAREIKAWVANGRWLAARRRPINYDDILILVQGRQSVFQEVIRALHVNDIPTPGADRLAVATHIAVLDLIALGDVMVNIADDLQLAALLRSPLFEISEDDLFAIAHGREKHRSLWWGLSQSVLPAARTAAETLRRWRGRLDFDRPFGFFTEVLYAGGGLRRFHARLGQEVDDVFAEFLRLALDHEQTPQPSLVGFLAVLRGRDITIKRELADPGNGVRVMTVHGAKGLEAPIVILADAATKPELRRAVFIRDETPGPLLVHSTGRGQDVAFSAALREEDKDAEKAEYWRRLYVAMTRAEDELYVTGAVTQRGNTDGSWYEAIEMALAATAEQVGDDIRVYPHRDKGMSATTQFAMPLQQVPPQLTLAQLPPHTPRRTERPSSAHQPDQNPEKSLATTLERALDPETARLEGIALHALLQHLVGVAPAERDVVVARALPVLLPDGADRHAALAARAMRILDNTDFAHLFGPQSRAEVPFLVHGARNGAPVRLAGRFDRLVVDEQGVMVLDYKSDAAAPKSVADVPGTYLGQMGLYALVAGQLFPGRTVRVGILWTSLESLMILPPAELALAATGFTMG